jgi:hypothetical protein
MLIKDLDGNSHNWTLRGNIAHGHVSNKSSLHLAARDLISEIFPTFQVLEEVPIPLRKSQTLYLDFYLPLNKLCIEVHGEQHYKFVAHYHNNQIGFLKHRKRDQEKIEWCKINDIRYVELPYDENIEQWRKRI